MVPRTVWFTDVRSVPFSAVPGPQNDQCPLGNLLAYATSEELDMQFSLIPAFRQSMSLYIDIKMIRYLNCSGSILFSCIVLEIS